MLFYTVLKGIFLHVFIANDEFIQKKIDLPPYYFLCRGRIKSNSSPNNISCIAFCQCKPKKKPRRHRNWGKLWDTPHRLGSCIFSLNFLWLTTTTVALSCTIVGVGFPELGWKKQRKIAKKQFLSERVVGSAGDFFFFSFLNPTFSAFPLLRVG